MDDKENVGDVRKEDENSKAIDNIDKTRLNGEGHGSIKDLGRGDESKTGRGTDDDQESAMTKKAQGVVAMEVTETKDAQEIRNSDGQQTVTYNLKETRTGIESVSMEKDDQEERIKANEETLTKESRKITAANEDTEENTGVNFNQQRTITEDQIRKASEEVHGSRIKDKETGTSKKTVSMRKDYQDERVKANEETSTKDSIKLTTANGDKGDTIGVKVEGQRSDTEDHVTRASEGIQRSRTKVNRGPCLGCVDEKGRLRKVRKSEANNFCLKHGKTAKFFCKLHQVHLCQLCVSQKPLTTEEVDKLVAVVDKAIGDKILFIIDEEIEKENKTERREVEAIHREADEKIGLINRKRELRLRQCHEDAERRRRPIENRRLELLSDLASLVDVTERVMTEMQTQGKDLKRAINDVTKRVVQLAQDNNKLIAKADKLIAWVKEYIGKSVKERMMDLIYRHVQTLTLSDDVERAVYSPEGDTLVEEWHLAERIRLPKDITLPRVVGRLNDDELVITNNATGSLQTYIISLRERRATVVITSDNNPDKHIVSCAMLGEDTIVCGKWAKGCTGDMLLGCVTLYNRKWKQIKNLAIPRNTSGDMTRVYVTVNNEGIIFAAEAVQTKIYFIKPADGTIICTLTCKENIVFLGLQPSGCIVARPSPCNNKLFVIEHAPEVLQTELTNSDKILNCGIDPTGEDLFVVRWDGQRKACVVDHLTDTTSPEGAGSREILDFQIDKSRRQLDEEDFIRGSNLVVTSATRMIACNGIECLIYVKRTVKR